MAKAVARVGDPHSHGGNITSGSGNVIVNGKGVARLGDHATCPIPGHGSVKIVTASGTVKANGKGVARVGDSLS